jgi:putative ABC transport system substrate-binding protein
MPVIGYLGAETPDRFAGRLQAFHQGLSAAGYDEQRNVAIEYRWAEGHIDRLPALAADLVRRRVDLIVAPGGIMPSLAAKAATTTIPIVFETGTDPIATGLVGSMNRPGGNITGITSLNVEVGPKRVELLHQMVPTATRFGLLVNPSNAMNSQTTVEGAEAAARALGLHLHILNASTEHEFDDAFATLARLRAEGLVIGSDTFLINRAQQLAALALRDAVPAIFQFREFAAAGGLMSYGGDFAETHTQAGVYAGRILKGEKPGDLPVQQATKVELIINLKTARALGLPVPLPLLGRANEVIE